MSMGSYLYVAENASPVQDTATLILTQKISFPLCWIAMFTIDDFITICK